MPYLRMVNKYRTLTGLERDVQTNTMHFAYNGDMEDACSDIASTWVTFLQNLDGLLSDDIYDTDIEQVFYSMEDPEPRVPVFTATFGATYANAVSMPLETSCVVSFAGPIVSGAGAGRRRGRIYLPAFCEGNTLSAAGAVVWNPLVVTQLASAFQDFCQDLLALTSPIALQVYSPTTDNSGGTLAQSMTAVTRGWVDNEPDTQRRRGANAGTKTSFVV